MPQLSPIANVQNLSHSEASPDKPSSPKPPGSESEFELQARRGREDQSQRRPETGGDDPPSTEDSKPKDVDSFTPLQLELYEFQQLDETPPTEEALGFEELLIPDGESTPFVIPEPKRPTQTDGMSTESTLPLDRARQLIEIAAAARPLNSIEGISQAQIEPASVQSVEAISSQVSGVESSELQLADQTNINSLSTPTNSPTSEVELPGAAQSPDVVKNVTSTVAENLVQQVELTENGADRKLIVQLHPAELGQVTLQVDWENETLKAKIFTNEFAANELLNQNKQQLVTALAENGISFDSLDVAYQDAPNEHTGEKDSVLLPNGHESGSENEPVATGATIPNSTTTMVDIVV